MPHEPLIGSLRLTGMVFAVAVALNFVWEMAQAPLYVSMGTVAQATSRCFEASVGDGVLLLVVLWTGAVVFRSSSWLMRRSSPCLVFGSAIGVGIAILVELWGLQTGRWVYTPHMPVIPGTPIGVVPLAQMAILVPLTFRLTHKLGNIRRAKESSNANN